MTRLEWGILALVLAVGAMIGLSGCAPDVVYKTIPVETPIEVACRIPPIQAPEWPTKGITAQNTLFDQVKALLAEMNLRKGYEGKLMAANQKCQ